MVMRIISGDKCGLERHNYHGLTSPQHGKNNWVGPATRIICETIRWECGEFNMHFTMIQHENITTMPQ